MTLLRANMGDYRSSDAFAPLSIAILADRTPKDIRVRFYDDKVECIPREDRPDLMAISVETFTARRAYELADQYRSRGVPVVMGGYHPTFLPDEAAEHADSIVIGDAEGSWEMLLDDFQSDRLKRFYTGGNARPLVGARADRGIFSGKRYAPIQPVQFGRGCRFSCDFCSIRTFYRDNQRQRPIDELVEDLSQLDRRKPVFFVDDNLFSSRERLQELLDAITPLRYRWACQISIDVARDERLLDRMRDAGCFLVLVGFESLSPENLRQMGKPWNRVSGDYRDVIHKFHDRGIAVYGTFVFGYDQDTPESIERSLDFALESQLEVANFNPLTPTPGSPLYERLKKEGRLLYPRWWLDPAYRYGSPIFEPAKISAQALAEKCYAARLAFYAWSPLAKRLLMPEAGYDPFRLFFVALANLISRREIRRKHHRVLGV